MRPIRVALLAVALLMTASCTRNLTPSPTATSTVAPSFPSGSVIFVPNVVGLSFRAAEHAIRDVGLSSDLTVMTGTYTHAAVVQQDPAPGTVLQPGATVHIVSGPA